MKVCEQIQESVLTPELGGFFQDLKLKIKPRLKPDQDKHQKKFITPLTDMKEGKINAAFDPIKFMSCYPEETLALVVGWENLISASTGNPIPFNAENAKRYLWNASDKPTGIEMEFPVIKDGKPTDEKEKRPARLFEYINRFAEDIENFEKN